MARLFREEQGWVRLEGRSPLVEQHLLGVRSLEASWHSGGGWEEPEGWRRRHQAEGPCAGATQVWIHLSGSFPTTPGGQE